MSGTGRSIGGHRLVAGLGSGGMARVYLAMSQKQFGFTKLVVLKVLRDDLERDPEFLDMFMHEARIAARLNHPNVVQTYEVGLDEGIHFIAMEYLEGQSLGAAITRLGADKIPLGFQLRVICDVLEGLHYAHELSDFDGTPLGIVHRDVSPQNVFVTYTGQAKLLDFGIAKTTSSTRTTHGVLKGKAGYMAPEQASLRAPDRRADIFAIGVMIWEAIARRRLVPRTEEDVVAITRRLAGDDPKIRDVVPDAPPELAAICDKAMARNPEDRWETAEALRDALHHYMATSCPFDTREVAALLTGSFSEERTRIRKLLEVQQHTATESAPIIDLKTERTVTPPRHTLAPPALTDPQTATMSASTGRSAFSSSGAPTMPPERRSRMPLFVGVAAVALLAGAFFVQRSVAANAGTTTTPPPSAAPAERATYTLTVTSDPPGARVYEGEAMLGRTPLSLPMNNAALRTAPRHIFVKEDGYELYRIDPQPSANDVDSRVALVKVGAAPTTSAAPTTTAPVFPYPGRAHPPTTTKPTAEPSASPAPPSTGTGRHLGIDPAPTSDLRPIDTSNPWEKK